MEVLVTSYSTAKMGLVGLTNTLIKLGSFGTGFDCTMLTSAHVPSALGFEYAITLTRKNNK